MKKLTAYLKEQKITEVECVICDMTGIARGKIAPVDKFIDEKGMRMPESVLLQTVTGDYVEDEPYDALLDKADIDFIEFNQKNYSLFKSVCTSSKNIWAAPWIN